jgi:hypothetical protein
MATHTIKQLYKVGELIFAFHHSFLYEAKVRSRGLVVGLGIPWTWAHLTALTLLLGVPLCLGGQILETEVRAETDKSTGVTVNKPYYNIHYQGWKDRCRSPPHHPHHPHHLHLHPLFAPTTRWVFLLFSNPQAARPSKQKPKD